MSDSEVAQFIELTGANDAQARQFLAGSNLETAIANYFQAQESSSPAAPAHNPSTAFTDSTGPPTGSDPSHANIDNTESNPGSGTATPGGGYTLSGQPVGGLPEGWGGSSAAPRVGRVGQWGSGGSSGKKALGSSSGPRIATFGSMASGGGDDEDSDEDEDEKRKRQLYAGGGKSGLAIEDPTGKDKEPDEDDVVAQILKQARDDTRRAQGEGSSAGAGPSRPTARSSAFTGGGNTLGSDETPSVPVPDPSTLPPSSSAPGGGSNQAQRDLMARLQGMLGGLTGMPGGMGAGRQTAHEDDDEDMDDEDEDDEGEMEGETAIRHLTFWKDGFSIEDGPLMRYDEPGNKEILEAIKSGRAPLSLLKVKFGQPVEVRVAQRSTEAYRPPPPRPMKAFEGSGNRLGSPAPEVTTTNTSQSQSVAMPGGFGAAASAVAAGTATGSGGSADGPRASAFQVNSNEPTTSIQVRLADGTKIVAKMNLTHTVGDIRKFVRAAQADARPFTIQTTFPNRILEDDSQTIADAKLANAVVVQRWA